MTPRAGAAPPLVPGLGSPAARGFRMPAEWEPHRATWLVWPHNRTDWKPKTSAVQWCYTEITRLLIDGEAVCVLFADREVERRARSRLRKAGVDPERIEAYRIATDRSWIRDSGPIFLVRPGRGGRGEVAVTDWRFNGWSRFRVSRRDNRLPRRVAECRGLERFTVECAAAAAEQPLPVVLEGGSIDVDGQGLLLATEECLLGRTQARNPQLTPRGAGADPVRLPRRKAFAVVGPGDCRRRHPRPTWTALPASWRRALLPRRPSPIPPTKTTSGWRTIWRGWQP